MNTTNATAAAMIPLILAAVLFFGTVLINIVLICRWHGWWRRVVCLPIAALIVWALVILVAVMRDSTAHNLWPLELVLWSASALALLGLIALLKRILKQD